MLGDKPNRPKAVGRIRIMNAKETYERIRFEFGYDVGLVQSESEVRASPVKRQLFLEASRLIKGIDALSFSGDTPVVYFRLLSDFDEDEVKRLHRLIWNQNRVPLLYVVTPAELRIYNCFEEPVKPDENIEARIIEKFDMAVQNLDDFNAFAKVQIDSGAFWKSRIGQCFRSELRVDYRLLEELRMARSMLRERGLSYKVIHDLLGRSIFTLYLEDRGAVRTDYYSQFLEGARGYLDILQSERATYDLFHQLEERFNGDLLPVSDEEKETIAISHLRVIHNLFGGGQVSLGQMALWRPYDFSVIPVELVSAIYEEFLHKEQGRDYTSETGAYYTPHPLVEFIMNEVLPWPSEKDHRYDLRILDPACGSGIFLVESFRRLVARWMFSHDTSEIPRRQLRDILTQYIHGIDINSDAIRVAAFSLYLALLDYLKPKTIWEKFQFPHLVYDSDSDGKNLFPMDTFPEDTSSNIPFESSDYDIVIGNPPWKRDNLPKHISDYCRSRGFAQEMVQAFLWRARDFVSNGKIALVATSKTLFNIEARDRHFRRQFFDNNYVEMVINFSALRQAKGEGGRQLFTSVVGPASVFIYRTNPPNQPKPTILYCTPKPTRANNALPGIIIDASEIKFLPRETTSKSDIIWKVAMWATQRDLELIKRLSELKTLGDYIDGNKGWYWARGLQRPSTSGRFKDEEIAGLSLIPTNAIKRYWLDRNKLEEIGKSYFYRKGDKRTYYAPHILIKRGPHKNRLCAVHVDFDCAFRDAVFGISAPGQELHLKALTAYLNSSFASYFMFLTASMWGVERDRVNKAELLRLPGIVFEMPENIIQDLADKVGTIQELMLNGGSGTNERIRRVETEIEGIVCGALGLSNTERMLIEDVLEYSLDVFRRGDKSKACDSAGIDDLVDYAKTFCDTLNSILRFGESETWATVYAGEAPLRLVSIHFNSTEEKDSIEIQQATDKLQAVLSDLESRVRTEYSESLYVRRSVKVYDEYTLHIVKPNEKQFWSRSMALRDATETLAEGLHRNYGA
jgi:hypothetical protein